MFGELIKLRELSRLLRGKRFLEVLVLARDPAIRDHKKARNAAEKARAALLDEATSWHRQGKNDVALERVRAVLNDGDDAKARSLEQDIRDDIDRDRILADDRRREIDRARKQVEKGDFSGAAARLETLSKENPDAATLLKSMEEHKSEVKRSLEQLEKAVDQGKLEAALAIVEDLRIISPTVVGLDAIVVRILDKATRKKEPAPLARALGTAHRMGCADTDQKDKAARVLVDQVEKELRKGQDTDVAVYLEVFPLRSEQDERAMALGRSVRRLQRARRTLDQGDLGMAEALVEESLRLAPKMPLAVALKEDVARRQAEAGPLVDDARQNISCGRLVPAREALVALLEKQPGHPDARDLLRAVEDQEHQDLETMRQAKALIDSADLVSARELLLGLSARRPELDDVPVLLRDIERRIRDEKMRGLEAESRLLHGDREPVTPPAPGPGARAALRRMAPTPRYDPTPRPLAKGSCFILRVEERGDWFVHPQDELIIGNSMAGLADLPILAAIGGRHARIRRVRDDDDAVRYRVEGAPTRKVRRNRKSITGEVDLQHGDVIDLGGIVSFTFLRPVPESDTAVLVLEGDFQVRNCRKILLFAESGAAGSIVIGPGPQAHVALAPERDRVEIIRETASGERLVARCPYGVAADEGPQRPQVGILSRSRIHTMDIDFFVDPVE